MKHFLSFLTLIVISLLFSASYAQTKIMSYNIRYANNHDGFFSWDKQKDKLNTKILMDDSKIVCMQEVMKIQQDIFNQKMSVVCLILSLSRTVKPKIIW